MMYKRMVARRKCDGEDRGFFTIVDLLEECNLSRTDADNLSLAVCRLNRELPIPPYHKWVTTPTEAWFTAKGAEYFGDDVNIIADLIDRYLGGDGYVSAWLCRDDSNIGNEVLYRDEMQIVRRFHRFE